MTPSAWVRELFRRVAAAAWVLFRRKRRNLPPNGDTVATTPPPIIIDDPPVTPSDGSAADALSAIEEKRREVDWRLRLLEDQQAAERETYAG